MYPANFPFTTTLDPSMVTLSTASPLCPEIQLDIVDEEGTPLDGEIMTYEPTEFKLRINTRNIENVGIYDLKVLASFTGDSYIQTNEYLFTVTLVDYCASPTITNPGQTNGTSPADYYYEDTAIFNLTPFTVSPQRCYVSYSCEEPLFNLCDFSDGSTTSLFDTDTGDFTFASDDTLYFGSQTISLTITGTAGGSKESFTFDLNLVDPCSTATFDIDSSIISQEISYNVHPSSTPIEVTLDPSLVTLTPDSNLCPSIEIIIIKEDESSLDDAFLHYDADTFKFRIDS